MEQHHAHPSIGSIGRAIAGLRRSRAVVSVDSAQEKEFQCFEQFQGTLADYFISLSSSDDKSEILSISWIEKLLHGFIRCLDEFETVVVANAGVSARANQDKIVADLLDRLVKALDICSAVAEGVDSVSNWHKQAQIASAALEQMPAGPGQFQRSKRALGALIGTIDAQYQSSRGATRNRSFSRKPAVKERCLRSLSWSGAKAWSAAKQLQAMAVNLHPPRSSEGYAVALHVYAMSSVILFVMWTIVAAIPCPDRSAVSLHFPTPPGHLPWAEPMRRLQERVAEEWRGKEKAGRDVPGLLQELQRLLRCSRVLLSLEIDQDEALRLHSEELLEMCSILQGGLVPLQQHVRDVFRRIVRSRWSILQCWTESSRPLLF